MTWLEFIPSVLIALALFIVPGLAVLGAGGMRGFFALAAAPPVSVVIVAGSAVFAHWLGMPFGIVSVLVLTAVGMVIALAFARIRLKANPEFLFEFPKASWAWWAGLGVSILLWARHIRNVLDRPDAFSQTFDNVWHLNVTRYIAATGNGSALAIGDFNDSTTTFYPIAFSDFAALVTSFNGGALAVAINAVVYVICGVVWPLGVMFLVRSILRTHDATAVGIGVLAASFPAFPLLLIDFGVLYANLLGLALLPVAVGVVVQACNLGKDRWIDWPRALIILLVAVPGIILGHANAFMLLLLISSVLVIAMAVRQVRVLKQDPGSKRAVTVRLVIAALVVVTSVVLWPILRTEVSVNDWPPPLSAPAAVGHALLNAPLGLGANWVVSILMIVGLLIAARARLFWLAAAWGVVAFFWLVVSSFPANEFRLMLVGIWYNDSSRFAANLPVLALPVAAVGLDWLVEQTAERLREWSRRPAWFTERWIAAFLTLTVLGGLVLTTQRTTSMNVAVDRASSNYAMDESSGLVTEDEFRLIERLPELVPEDAVIAVNPWNGSALAYAFADREVTAPHIFYGMTPVREIVYENLDEAAFDAEVCPVLMDENVRYVLDFGSMGVHGRRPYEGLDAVRRAPGFELVASEGDARLYEITACDW
ncbi:MAG TPA: DUF6541 family protein [Actinomycetaceae bacterium]|nr:DUF6541 family protein [Actinomycetaceae bacterium]